MKIDKISAVRDVPSLEGKVSDEEWKVRVDLAACYRLIRAHGWNHNIYNHCSARVPGEPDKFLMKGHALLWDEVTASNLVKVDMNAELDERAGVNRPGFVLHSAILRARPDVNAVVHIHESSSVAVSVTRQGLLPLTQDAIFFFDRIGYHDYHGITENAEERAQIVAALGDKPAMLMRSHGSVTVGANVRAAYVLTNHLVTASKIQMQLMASGADLVIPSPEVCRGTVKQYESHNNGRGQDDWPAALRELDRTDDSYRH